MATTLDTMLETTPDVCGGRIRIEGTRITVHRIASLYKQGRSAEDVCQTYPHLSLAQIYTALAHYQLNREAIEEEFGAAVTEYGESRCRQDDAGIIE